jgi:hypothetical protein
MIAAGLWFDPIEILVQRHLVQRYLMDCQIKNPSRATPALKAMTKKTPRAQPSGFSPSRAISRSDAGRVAPALAGVATMGEME